jgi:hypothetical protein
MSNLDQIKIVMPKFNLPPFPLISSPKSIKTTKAVEKNLNKVFVVIYINLDDPDEPQVKVSLEKGLQ